MLTKQQIEHNFTYHSPTETQIERMKILRSMAKELALEINNSCPNSRESSLALTKLEESIMWANAAIVRY